MTEEQKKQIRSFRTAGMGYKRISAALDIPLGTVKSFCRRDEADMLAITGYEAVEQSESQSAKPVCLRCGKPVIRIPGRKKRRFCSEACRVAYWRIATENGRCAPDAENPCRAMTGAENSAVMPVISTAGLRRREEAGTHSMEKAIYAPFLTHDQLQRELTYRVSIAILRDLRDAGLVNGKEFVRTSQFLAERFSPVWGGLYQDHG